MKTSIIIAARAPSAPVLGALASLAQLGERARLEVIVVNCCGQSLAKRIAERFPGQLVIDALPNRTLIATRYAGVERSTGDIIAILHECYTVDDAWLAALESVHMKDIDVATGPIAPFPNLTLAESAVYLNEYSHIAPPLAEGELGLAEAMRAPGGNVSYRRRVFDMASMAGAMWDWNFHGALHRAGASFVRRGGMRAVFRNPYTMMEFLAERCQVSHDFAWSRERGRSASARAALAVKRLGLPPWLTLRVIRQAWARPDLRGRLWRALPLIAGFSFVQMVAEIQGTFAGRGSVNRGFAGTSDQARRSFLSHKCD